MAPADVPRPAFSGRRGGGGVGVMQFLQRAEPATGLELLANARLSLEEAVTIVDFKRVRDQTEGFRIALKTQGIAHEMQNQLALITLQSERGLGTLLAGLDRQPGGRPSKNSNQAGESFMATLKAACISYTQSQRWQMAALIPEPVFRQHVAAVLANPVGELTSAAVVEIGKRYAAEKRAASRQSVEDAREQEPVPDLPFDIEVGDAADLPLDSNTIDLIITSPPYGLDKPYVGVDDSAQDWYSFMVEWLGEAYRVTTDGGRLALNVPLDTTHPEPRATYSQAVAAALEAGWAYRWTIVWNEGNVSNSVARGSVDSASAPHVITPVEMIGVFHKGEWPRSAGESDIRHADWLEWTNGHWTFSGESRPWEQHPAAFPVELPMRLIRLLSFRGDYVLDPFLGSGTTLVAAYRTGRNGIGYDLSPEHVASARRRLAAEMKGQ